MTGSNKVLFILDLPGTLNVPSVTRRQRRQTCHSSPLTCACQHLTDRSLEYTLA